MAGYNDTRNLIIEALMGRQAGTEIQPEKHQAYALNMLDYVRSVELVSSSTLVGLAEENTVPVQPNKGKVCYIAGVSQDRTVTFSNFIDNEGNPISITTGEMEGVFVILLWNMKHWVAYTFNTNIISSAESANFYYGYNIRKTYESVAAMNTDSTNPIGTDGKYIKVGEIVTVVNSTTPSENGFYSYEGSENGWLLQSGFSFEVVQTTGTDINKTMSQKAVTDELDAKADHGYDVEETPKTLKEVDDSLAQLADDVIQITSIDLLENTTIIHNEVLTLEGRATGFINFDTTDYIAVKEGDEIIYSGFCRNNEACLVTYDSNKNMLSVPIVGGEYKTNVKITIGSGVKYIRASSTNELHASYPATFVLLKVLTANEIERRINEVNAGKIDKTSIKQALGTSTTDVMSQKAVTDIQGEVNKRVCIFPYGIDKSLKKDGSLGDGSHFTVTPFIPVVVGETIECQGYSGGTQYDFSLLCTYNSNKEFIADYGNDGSFGLKKYSLTIPSGVAYIRVGTKDDATSIDYYTNSYVNCRIIAKLLSSLTTVQENQENIAIIREYSESIFGKVINTADGNTVSLDDSLNPNQGYSDFIPVKPGQSVLVSGWFASQVGGVGYNQNQEYCSRLFDISDLSVYKLPAYSVNQKIIIPDGVYYIRSSSKDNVNYPLKVVVENSIQESFNFVQESFEKVYDYIDNKNVTTAPIRIHKIDSTNFYVAIYDNIANKDLFHYFTLQNYTKTLNYGSGLTKDCLCADIWYPNVIKKDGIYLIQGNLNFIYLIDGSLSNEPSSPFYNEKGHVGAGHGCEIKEFQRFFADGKEFDISTMDSSQDLYCNEFRIICKANNYAVDVTQPGFSGPTATLKLDDDGNPILTAIHTYIATFKANNNIIWDNNLFIKRNGVKFQQCHGAMCQGNYPYFNNVTIMNNNYDNNNYIISEGTVMCTPIGTSIDLKDNIHQVAEEVMLKGDDIIITQKMTQAGDRYNKNFAMLIFYTDPIAERLKIYQQPVKTASQYSPSEVETFNEGDIIKVHVERNIAILH